MVNDSKGYYQALGLTPGASIADVKKAYKKKQVELHPSGAVRQKKRETAEYMALSEEMKQKREKELDMQIAAANEAFNVLSVEDKKKSYDEGTGEFSAFNMGGGFSDFGDIGDIFNQFVSGRGGRQAKQQYKVKDTITEVKVSIRDVFMGLTNKYKVKLRKICETCDGKGAKDVSKCGKCSGRGTVYMQRNLGLMVTRSEVECPDCAGRGEVAKGPVCTGCKGERTTAETEIIEVKIRSGINDGETICFKGRGNQMPGCVNGDLVFHINVIPNDKYARVDDHLLATVDIDILSVLSGGVCYFDHPDGRKMAVKFPPFKSFETAIRVTREGFPGTSGAKGDLVIKPNILLNSGLDRAKLSEYLKPLVSKPYGEYQNIGGSLGKPVVPKEEREEYDREYHDHGRGKDFFQSFSFF